MDIHIVSLLTPGQSFCRLVYILSEIIIYLRATICGARASVNELLNVNEDEEEHVFFDFVAFICK